MPHKVRPPILRYLGHILARPSWAHKARSDYLGMVQADLAQYQSVPLNGWERAQLVNFVLLPRWLQRLVPPPPLTKTLHQVDTLVSEFIRAPKGMEATMNNNMLGTPPKEGGMGVRHMYWAYRRKYVTSLHMVMWVYPELFPYPWDHPSPALKHPC